MATPTRITVDGLKEEIGVTDAQLSLKCPKMHLRAIAPSVSSYTAFASKFNIPEGYQEGIKLDQSLNFVQKTEKIFMWWEGNTMAQDSNYQRFMEVCIELGEGDLARQMCKLCATRLIRSNAKQSMSLNSLDDADSQSKNDQLFKFTRSSRPLDINRDTVNVKTESSDHEVTLKPRINSAPTSGLSGILNAIQWEKSEIPAPDSLMRSIDSVVHGDVAYFRNRSTCIIHSYHKVTKKWDKLPECLVADTSLVFLPVTCQGSTQFHLHTIGGRKLIHQRENDRDEFTGAIYQLYNIVGIGGTTSWKVANYPDIKFKRSQVTVAYCNDYVIAAGGCSEYGIVGIIEVLNISHSEDDNEWFDVVCLPQPVFRASACVCNGQLYILGGHVQDLQHGWLVPTNTAYVAEVRQLVGSLNQDKKVFSPIKTLPLQESAFVSFHSYVVAIGGWQFSRTKFSSTKYVHIYDKEKEEWIKLKKKLNEPRCQNFAAAFEDEIMTVGGYENPCGLRINSMEFVTV